MGALQCEVYPGTGGWSGLVARYLSSWLLNLSTLHPVVFLMFLGRLLKILGPLYGRLAESKDLSLADAWAGGSFLRHFLPVLAFM